MPRGRKKRVLQCHPPPKGYYTVDWVINDLVSLNALSGPALSLWLHLKGLAWERGECDPTDERLAELMGGVTAEMVRITRRELRSKHLLIEYQKPGAPAVRWLIPLPVLSGLRGNLPAEIVEDVASGEAQLWQTLAQRRSPKPESHAGSNGHSPQVEFGANSICSKLVLKEEEGRYPGEFYLPPAPERVNAIARGNGKGGAGGGRIYPKQNLGLIQLGANSTGGEIVATAADAAAAAGAERAELIGFLVEHGIFASVAGNLVEWLLAHKTVAEAKVYALAHLRAVQEGENPRGQRLNGEQAIGRWVARLREHARAPEWALARAARELEASDDADEEMLDVDDAELDDEVTGQLPAEDETEVVEEVACIPLNGQLARPSAVWQQVKTQLRYQTDHGTYDIWIANTDGIGVEDAPEAVGTSQTLVVQVLSQYAADWLEMRLKPLVLRTLQGLVGSSFGVRFQTE
jgi:hypothetical protein